MSVGYIILSVLVLLMLLKVREAVQRRLYRKNLEKHLAHVKEEQQKARAKLTLLRERREQVKALEIDEAKVVPLTQARRARRA